MIVPKGRTVAYAVFRACERFGILPPTIKPDWDEMTSDQQALLIAYNQVREHEEVEMSLAFAKAFQ